jgi:hypothetical protein
MKRPSDGAYQSDMLSVMIPDARDRPLTPCGPPLPGPVFPRFLGTCASSLSALVRAAGVVWNLLPIAVA